MSGIIELAALARLAAVRERRFGNRESMCPYKRPYNSGTIRIRLLPFPSVMGTLTCGKRPVGYCPAPSFPACFRFPKPCVAGSNPAGGADRESPGQSIISRFNEMENWRCPYRIPTNSSSSLARCGRRHRHVGIFVCSSGRTRLPESRSRSAGCIPRRDESRGQQAEGWTIPGRASGVPAFAGSVCHYPAPEGH